MLSYWIRSSEDPDKQPYISSGFQQLLQESQTPIHSLMLWGMGGGQAVASQDSRRGPGDLQVFHMLTGPGTVHSRSLSFPKGKLASFSQPQGAKMSSEIFLIPRNSLRGFYSETKLISKRQLVNN